MFRDGLAALLGDHPRIHLDSPKPYRALAQLLAETDLLLTDSGGLQEEAPALGLPTLILRTKTERWEPVETGHARLVGLDPAKIITEANRVLDDPFAYAAMAKPALPYGRGDAATYIGDAIESWWREDALLFPSVAPYSKARRHGRTEDGDEMDARQLASARGKATP